MLLNNAARKIWIFTISITLFTFLGTTFFYGFFYKQQVEKSYLNDFNEIILNVENVAETDPSTLTETLNEYNTLNSRIHFSLKSKNNDPDLFQKKPIQFPPYIKQHLMKEKKVEEAVEVGKDVQIQGESKSGTEEGTPYIFRIKNFYVDGAPAVLYSYTDLSFLQTLEGRMVPIFTWLLLVYSFLGYLYYQYLKNKLSLPIRSMTNVAFEYAQNKFDKRLEITGTDDLTQLATAMNKMGYSLETKGTAVKQEKELLSKILSVINTGVLFFDSDHTLLLSNPAGEIFYNRYKAGEWTTDHEDSDQLSNAIQEVMQQNKTYRLAVELDDNYYTVTVSPLLEEGSSFMRGYVISSQDTTNENRLDKMRVDFINNVSHELRTPLVMVQGYSEAIIDDVAETEEDKKEMASIIRDESQRMSRMVNELLNLSRMEAGYIELSKEKLKTMSYFKRLLSRFRKMADQSGVELEVEIDTDVAYLYVDRDKIDQVFVNLVNNAIRHTGMSGNDHPCVKIWVHFDQIVDQVLVEIIDNGTGIPEEDIPFIFERFYKADKARKNLGQNKMGTGIGLSLVKEIVQAHGGNVEVKSREGEGSTFIIRLPYVEPSAIES